MVWIILLSREDKIRQQNYECHIHGEGCIWCLKNIPERIIRPGENIIRPSDNDVIFSTNCLADSWAWLALGLEIFLALFGKERVSKSHTLQGHRGARAGVTPKVTREEEEIFSIRNGAFFCTNKIHNLHLLKDFAREFHEWFC